MDREVWLKIDGEGVYLGWASDIVGRDIQNSADKIREAIGCFYLDLDEHGTEPIIVEIR